MNHDVKRTAIQLIKNCQQCHRIPRSSLRRHVSTVEKREWSTPLAKTLADAIKTTGPISIAAFMRQVLTNPDGGYYTSPSSLSGTEVFGKKGDFITSPEITQVFGELIGIWTVTEWIAQGRPSGGVELIEAGPGKGTLMDDILRTIRNFKSFASSIDAIYLIEASPSLREIQKQVLCGADATLEEINIGHRGVSKHIGVPVIWVEDIRLMPQNNKTPFIFAHEFFDALPIHAFQSVAPSPDSNDSQKFMTPTGPITLRQPLQKQHAQTPQWRELMVALNSKVVIENQKEEPEFQLSLAKASNSSSLVIPEISERYKALKSQPGSIVEISPESRIYVADFAHRIGGFTPKPSLIARRDSAARAPSTTTRSFTRTKPSGAALILDYGTTSTIPVNSLRGIRNHARVSPFMFPGQVDVSADVDFTSLAETAIAANKNVEVHGPVEQADFLQAMGIAERAEQLLQGVTDEEKRKILQSGWKRLVDRGPNGMGKIYKALAIVPENGGLRRPVGFGGGVGR